VPLRSKECSTRNRLPPRSPVLFVECWIALQSAADPWVHDENTNAADIEPLLPPKVGEKVTFYRQPQAGRMFDSVEVVRTESRLTNRGCQDFITPDAIAVGNRYFVAVPTMLRAAMPDENYRAQRAIGAVEAGAVVQVLDKPKAYTRSSGPQFWARVQVNPSAVQLASGFVIIAVARMGMLTVQLKRQARERRLRKDRKALTLCC
jgi:hypothetical protein